jgi:DNA polymerase-1
MEITKTDGKLHTQYNIARTATGRLSAQEPNLQQVPRINEIRSLICPHDGKVFIEADYSQIELRVAAFIAHAESMKNVYRKGGDIHTSTACKLAYTTAPTKEERTKAKAANFGFLYGMGWKSFKDYAYDNYGLELTDDEAMEMRRAFFQAYPELITWHETQRSVVRVHKKVVSPFGRVRHLFDVTSPDKAIASGAERQAINTPVQSMASDMTVLAMIELDKVLDSTKASIVGQIHDAILIEVDEDYADEALEITKLIMEDLPIEEIFGVKLDLPIVADAQISSSWGNKK